MNIAGTSLKNGRYRMLDCLGTGGMGVVYLAWDTELERHVAIKKLGKNHNLPAHNLRLRRESKILAKLNHPHIVQVYDILDTGEQIHLVMEFVSGGNLSAWLREKSPSLAERLDAALQILEGLSAAHHSGIIHRDLKPENILVSDKDRIKIVDFGIGISLSTPVERLTLEGTVVGSPGAMSPEQYHGGNVDHRSDLYSFGLLFFELLTGERIGDRVGLTDKTDRILEKLSNTLGNSARDLAALITRLLQYHPESRPQNAREVVHVIAEIRKNLYLEKDRDTQYYLSGHGDTRYVATQSNTVHRAILRRKLGVFSALAGILATSALGLWLWANSHYIVTKKVHYVLTYPPKILLQGNEDPDLPLQHLIHSAVVEGLLSLDGVILISDEEIPGGNLTPLAAGEAVHADTVVASYLQCDAQHCELRLSRLNVASRGISDQRQFPVSMETLLDVHHSIAGQVQFLMPEYQAKKGKPDLGIDPQSYADFLSLWSRKARGEFGEPERQQAVAITKKWPNFLPAYDLLVSYHTLEYHKTQNQYHLRQARVLISQMSGSGQHVNAVKINQIKIWLKEKHYDDILPTLAQLRENGVDEVSLARLEALYWQQTGDFERALQVVEAALALRRTVVLLYRKAVIHWYLGDMTRTRTTLAEALAISPEYVDAIGLLADTELLMGQARAAQNSYRRLLTLQDDAYNRNNYGLALYLQKKFAEAEKEFLTAHEAAPMEAAYLLNLADSTLLQGKTETAHQYYRSVLALLEQQLDKGLDYFSIKAQALLHMGEKQAALIALREAQKVNSENLEVLYVAALIYAALEETTSATVHARLAVKQGMSYQWFLLPWFDKMPKDFFTETLNERKND